MRIDLLFLLLGAGLPLWGCAPEGTPITRGPVGRATFVQAQQVAVDILWVIDNSSTFMTSVQQRLAFQLPALIEPLAGLDVQMAVATTTISDPWSVFPFDGSDLSIAHLSEALLVGDNGSDQERGLQVALQVLDPTLGFVRPDAHLVIVFVSDEEDCSDNGQLAGELGSACYTSRNRLVPIEAYAQAFMSQHGDDLNRTTAVSIGATPISQCQAIGQERYARVARSTGGPVLDICADSFLAHMTRIGQIASGLRQGIVLSSPARETSLEVYVDAERVDSYDYRPRNWIVLFDTLDVPPAGAAIDVFYEVDGSVVAREP